MTDFAAVEWQGKTAVITGGASGIGLGIARACLDRGMQVMLSDVDAARVSETAAGLRAAGGDVAARPCDVRDRNQVDELRDAALAAFGGLELVCNNAGLGLSRSILETTTTDWDLLLDVNLGGVINGVSSFVPLLIEQGHGHLSATASLSGVVADPDLMVYNATKFGVVGIMESLALELRRDHAGVGASVLCPGPVATDLITSSDAHLVDAGAEKAQDEDIAAYLAAGMHPDEVGRIAVDGIAAGDFWLLSHPELTFELLDARSEAMRQRRLATYDEAWTDQN